MRWRIGRYHSSRGRRYHWRSLVHVVGAMALSVILMACAARPPLPAANLPQPPQPASNGQTIALLGATGMTGQYLLREALARGYAVRALARTPAKLDAFGARITIVQGDARDAATIEKLLRGSDVVISALGPVKADGDAAQFISTTATQNIVAALEGTKISQYMVVSGAGVVMPEDDRNVLGWWIRTLAQIGLHNTLRDKQAEYAVLASSSVFPYSAVLETE